ncbi:hypothetical protein [Paraburkholderia sp. HP33-1]|nr:hypothetical protein [Paraburkholderia sp. HP33-1]
MDAYLAAHEVERLDVEAKGDFGGQLADPDAKGGDLRERAEGL